MFKIRKLMLLSILLFSFNSIFGYKLVALNGGSRDRNVSIELDSYNIKPNFGSFLHLDIVKLNVKFRFTNVSGVSL